MKLLHILIATVFLTSLGACSSSSLIKVEDFKKEVGVREALFIHFNVDRPFNNPFDQKEVMVDAHIVSPSGKSLVLPCFYFQEDVAEKGNWQARFTPREQGEYSFKIGVKTEQDEIYSKSNRFTSVASEAKGLLSLDKDDPFFMKLDNGAKFRGIGLNVGWVFEPKWNNPDKYSYETFFNEMAINEANFVRLWICPWNMPIEWSPVTNYQMLVEEFTDWSKMISHTKGLAIHEGTSPVTQSDEGQLIKTSATDESITYEIEAVHSAKVMIYYKGQLDKEDIEILYSSDSIQYQSMQTEFSESWESIPGWRRIFLITRDEIPASARFAKIVFKKTLNPDHIKISGVQFAYGDVVSTLDCNGLGQFSAKNSKKMDALIHLAQSKNIYFLLSLGYHGSFYPNMDSWGANDEWQRNPYNQKNGGPCDSPADFFSNPEAKTAYKNYLRYFVARWGYSEVIAIWEFWNEIDLAQQSQTIPVDDLISWHGEMADYLKSIDPFNHMVTTSLSGDKFDHIWNLKNLDMTQIHHYEPSIHFAEQTIDMVNRFNKPHIIGEYAVDWKGPGFGYSAQDYEDEFHDGMWRGLFSPTSVMPLSWWWEFHFDNKQYFHFKPIAHLTQLMEKHTAAFSLVDMAPIDGFQTLGMVSDGLSIVWIKNLKDFENADVNIPVKQAGAYSVRMLNTRTNELSDGNVLKSTNGVVELKEFKLNQQKDMAIIVILEK